MPSFTALAVWLVMLAAFYMLSSFLESRAAMRGSHRKPMPKWVDKSIRMFFLVTFVAPAYALCPWPWVFALGFLCYLPTYLDEGEKTGKRVSSIVRNLPVWRFVKWYFEMDIATPHGKLDPTKKYILGMHPHGFLPIASMVSILTDVCGVRERYFNGVHLRSLAASFCFYIPIYRDIILGGGIIDAARYNARNALEQGLSIALVPGGATEGLYASPGKHILVLKKRKGFIKLAMEHGADLVPSYSFGETDCYNQLSDAWPPVKRFQAKFQRVLGLSLPLVTNLIPNKAKVTIVFGKPIEVKKNPKPTDAEVEALLEVYMTRLREHFEEWAPTYIPNPEHRKLEII
eukprot:CAMPEP_0174851174 /NCGR_PEP_ID=MMETSP1114-20130205/22085_1 /TAXON_ID=312471 /ORGANISM="Neobodo designis, Strain CCAP 1951/1" /LENGTH=344 /DNA_ID=CAMNT_0016085691 /DNA_START=46 /DNA_END=1080 /DNA_ORIENTATION=+